MSGYTNPWTRHYQGPWEERAGNPRLPDWLRVASLAYGKHGANGHALFGPGEVALVLGEVDFKTGEIRTNQNVSRAIKTAVVHGWLAKGSKARCLIVPAHSIEGGMGSPWKSCPQHGSNRVTS
jgi:hypothetical protein